MQDYDFLALFNRKIGVLARKTINLANRRVFPRVAAEEEAKLITGVEHDVACLCVDVEPLIGAF